MGERLVPAKSPVSGIASAAPFSNFQICWAVPP